MWVKMQAVESLPQLPVETLLVPCLSLGFPLNEGKGKDTVQKALTRVYLINDCCKF